MIGRWYVEAGRYNVLPVDRGSVARLAEQRPQIAARTRYTYYPHTHAVPADTAVVVLTGRTASPPRSTSRSAARTVCRLLAVQ